MPKPCWGIFANGINVKPAEPDWTSDLLLLQPAWCRRADKRHSELPEPMQGVGCCLRPSQQQQRCRAKLPLISQVCACMSPTSCKPNPELAQNFLSEHTCQAQRWPAGAQWSARAPWLQNATGRHRTCRLALEVQCSPKEAQQRKGQHGCSLQKEASSPAQGPCYCAPQDVACRAGLASMGMQHWQRAQRGTNGLRAWARNHQQRALGNVFAHGSADVSSIMRPAGPSAALCRWPKAEMHSSSETTSYCLSHQLV